MSEKKFNFPTGDDARDRYVKKVATPLDKLICYYQPSNHYYARIFRQRLEEAIQYVIENLEPRLLTMD